MKPIAAIRASIAARTSSLKLERRCNHRMLSSLAPPRLSREQENVRKGNHRGAAVAAVLMGSPSFCSRGCCVAGAPRRRCWRQKTAAAAARGRPCSCQTPFHSSLGSGSGSFMLGFILLSVGAAIFLSPLLELAGVNRWSCGCAVLSFLLSSCGCCKSGLELRMRLPRCGPREKLSLSRS
ncbi:uncharacterized protein LOC130973603 isoform X2 [Arachis stenosperma]|uniref:uncharacterized protein LOC130973603 isoform X2 n=1 Tax=Arachis stenosperma TaxID=217475 RepID=UPI0025AD0DB4|nr:uncharacterized protein LOC130973603 isoform X2 [Arachis stenosperma]